MKVRTLVSNRLYFGLEPLAFRRGAERTIARRAKTPVDQARVSVQALAQDFELDPARAEELMHAFVADGLLRPDPGHGDACLLTPRFGEFALARVVPPLHRVHAKELLDRACRLARKINAEWTSNPLAVDLIAVSGGYMTRSRRIAELTLWMLVRSRTGLPGLRFRAPTTGYDGAAQIDAALRALSSFIHVHIVTDRASIERPFAVPFRDEGDVGAPPPVTVRLLAWGSSLRRQLEWARRRRDAAGS